MASGKVIPLLKKDGTVAGYAIVDAADYEWLAAWNWHLDLGYVTRCEHRNGRSHTIRMHREILGLERGDGKQADHINRNRLDNRRENLRVVTDGENKHNLPSCRGSTSRYRGVCWDRARGKWVAAYTLKGKFHYLGRFDSELEAARKAEAARQVVMPYAQPDPELAKEAV